MSQKRILDMIKNGKINAAEGAELLAAMNPQKEKSTQKNKKLRFEIIGKDDNILVNFSLPIGLLKFGVGFLSKEMNLKINHGSEFDFSCIDWKELLELAANEEEGDLLNLEVNNDNGENVKIRISIA